MAVSEATLLAKISALEKRVSDLSAKVQADHQNIAPLYGAGNLAFLASLGKMGFLDQLTDDPFSGSTWGSGERDYVNAPIDKWNRLQTELINQNLMFPT